MRTVIAVLALVAFATFALPSATAGGSNVFVSTCGVLKAYRGPTYVGGSPVDRGSITIGSQTFQILMGSETVPQAIGTAVCLIGANNTPGALLDVFLTPFPDPYCGLVIVYRPPTSTADGVVTIGDRLGAMPGFFPSFRIGAGTPMPSDIPEGGSRCFRTSLDANGDGIVVGLVAASTSASPSRRAGPLPSQMPNTATDVSLPAAAPLGALGAFAAIAVVFGFTRRRRSPRSS
jgi:hypothetical protein